jgi:hypothetical protein
MMSWVMQLVVEMEQINYLLRVLQVQVLICDAFGKYIDLWRAKELLQIFLT